MFPLWNSKTMEEDTVHSVESQQRPTVQLCCDIVSFDMKTIYSVVL